MAGLDGWRAISILAVLFAHSRDSYFHGFSLHRFQDFCNSGVYVFFAISGLLICTRLLEEEKLLGRVNLKGFYIRRFLRIQPVAIAYLLVVALLSVSGWVPQYWRYWFGALFLFRNYQTFLLDPVLLTKGYLTGHFWTLAVEEHFYLLLSCFLFFVRSRRLVLLAGAYVIAFAMQGVLTRLLPLADRVEMFRHTEEQLQYLIPSAFLAILLMQPAFANFTRKWLPPGPVVSLTILVATASLMIHGAFPDSWLLRHKGIAIYVVPEWYGVYGRMFPLWILATVTHPESWTTRFLETRVMVWIGRISYSLYLWHVLFYRGPWPASIAQPASPLVALTYGPWNLIASFVCATASFYLLERPLMRLGHKLAPPSTPGRLDMQTEPSIEAAIELEHVKAEPE